MAVDLDTIRKEYEAIAQELTDPGLVSDWEKFEALSKKRKKLEKIIEKQKEIEAIENQIDENQSMITANEEKDLTSLAKEDILQLEVRIKTVQRELEKLLQEDTPTANSNGVIVEIRAGTGGDEAALFAARLLKMYTRYADSKGWQQNMLDSHPTELGGFKEVIISIKGNGAFSKLKYEAGVHRVQRIPETEKSGRVHTSTASVAILPKPKKTEVTIRPDEIKVDFYRSSGPGGQYVNKRESAVRITHHSSGIVVTSQTERNQLQNKENALTILAARILEKQTKEEHSKIADKRKTQIGGAKRAEKIRTYNFPQDRVTDHRIKKSWHNIEEIMQGKLDNIIKALQTVGVES